MAGVSPIHLGFAVREEVHHCVVDDGIWQWVAAYITTLRVPLEELEVGDEYAMSITAGEEVVGVGHVDNGSAFNAVLVSGVEADVVLDIKFPQSLVILEGKTEEVSEDEPILVVGVDAEIGVDDPGGGILEHCVWDRVVQPGPMRECMGPYVSAEEVLAVDGGGDVGEYGLYIAFYRVLPLLVGCGALMAAMVVLIELVGLC